MSAPRTALIAGAGVAGPALAYWLRRTGVRPTIVERAPALRAGGYAVDVRGAPMHVVRRMGLLPILERRQTHTGSVVLVDAKGRRLAAMPDGLTSGELEVMRGDLAGALYHATRDETEYLFGDSITSLHDTGDGVHVAFANERPRTFDLVVGADGVHSGVRALAFGPEASFIRHLGCYVSIFTMENLLRLDRTGAYYPMPGRVAGLLNVGDPRRALASFYFSAPPLAHDRLDAAGAMAIVADRFRGAAWAVPGMLDAMTRATDFYFDSISLITMDRWSAGRIALVGDAAYCASPLSGMGTGMAMVGAYVLAGELAAAGGDHRLAFQRYEARMRPYVAGCQQLADGGASWFIPTSRLRRWLLVQMYRVLPHTPWKRLMIDIPMRAANGITLEHYEWDEPPAPSIADAMAGHASA